ncbi:serine protease [Methylobacterium nigriterrae]|uniref:serine protease n=1 Tax=Methylobacterium nigriterrae TaxID=3127512 RepID=UPI003013A4F6
MTEGLRFVGSRVLAGLDEMRIDDRAVVEDHERLRRILRQRGGDGAAALFAEPVLSRSNGSAPARIDWYTALDGHIRPLLDLDPDRAADLRCRIQSTLSEIEPVLRDPNDGPFVAACLNLASPLAILAVGDDPLLIDWGLLPIGLVKDESARARHHAEVLNSLLPDGLPAPPIGREDWVVHFRPSVSSARLEDVTAPRATPPQPRIGTGRTPVVATAIAGCLLALSCIPGVLLFPMAPHATSGEVRAMQAAWLDSLRRRRDVLAAAGRFACPHLRTELPNLVPQSPAGVSLTPGDLTHSRASAAIDPPASTPAPGPTTPPSGAGLVDQLERGTVLVLAGEVTGSGFFVTDDMVVTNRHVVENAQSLLIAGRHVGVVQAALVRIGGAGTLEDFALLRVARQSSVRPLALATPSRPLTPVVAAGFPGLYLGTDPTFARLREGDASAGRDLEPVFQTGVINHLQRYEEAAVTLVLHGAEIAPGNSGGPLVDYCGRVVGVNSFGRTDDRLPVTARYALGADGLAGFLRSAGLTALVETKACELQTAPREAVTAAAAPPDPVPGAAAEAPVQAAPTPRSPAPPRTAPPPGSDARPPAR